MPIMYFIYLLYFVSWNSGCSWSKIWDYIEEGTELCVIESMKMQQSLLSGNSGFVRAIFINDGDSVNTGDVVVQIQ